MAASNGQKLLACLGVDGDVRDDVAGTHRFASLGIGEFYALRTHLLPCGDGLADIQALEAVVNGRAPGDYAALIDRVLRDGSDTLRAQTVARSMRYRWSIAAARLRRHYDDLAARAPVKCS